MLGRENPHAEFLIQPFDLLYVSFGVPACPSCLYKQTTRPQVHHSKIKSRPYSQLGCGWKAEDLLRNSQSQFPPEEPKAAIAASALLLRWGPGKAPPARL